MSQDEFVFIKVYMFKTYGFSVWILMHVFTCQKKYIMLVLFPQYIEVVLQISSYSKQFSKDEERKCTYT